MQKKATLGALLLILLGWSIFSPLTLAAINLELTNLNPAQVRVDRLVGLDGQTGAQLLLTNLSTTETVKIQVRPGTLLKPNVNDPGSVYELVLLATSFDIAPASQKTIELKAYLGDLGNGGKSIPTSSINYQIAGISDKAVNILTKAVNRSPNDNGVQLALWAALGNRTFDELAGLISANISSYRSDVESLIGNSFNTSTPAATNPATASNSPTTTSSSGATATPTIAAAACNTSGGCGIEPIIPIVAVITLVFVIALLLILRSNQRTIESNLKASTVKYEATVGANAQSAPKPIKPFNPPPKPGPQFNVADDTDYVPSNNERRAGERRTGAAPSPLYDELSEDYDYVEDNETDEAPPSAREYAGAGKTEAVGKPYVLLKVEKNTDFIQALEQAKQEFQLQLGGQKTRLILSRNKIPLFVIGNSTISAPHAMLECTKEGNFCVTDLFSSNGTYLPRYHGKGSNQLGENGRINPDLHSFTVEPDEFNKAHLRFGSVSGVYDFSTKRLSNKDGELKLGPGKRVLISRLDLSVVPLTVSSSGNKLYADSHISTPHALLELSSASFELKDLNSQWGILDEKNSKLSSKSRLLEFGTPFTMGNTTFKIIDTRVRVGDVIKNLPNYTIVDLKPVGEGGMGRVYKCFRIKDNQTFALKIPHGEKYLKKQYQTQFENEQQIMRMLNPDVSREKGIVTLVDSAIIKELDLPYYVMDFIDGVSLRDILKAQTELEAGDAVFIILKLLAALDYSHKTTKIAHCDVSAGNVMIDRKGKIWLTDFGIATKIGEKAPLFRNKYYAAPELPSGGQVTEATDIYSVGVLLAQLLSDVQRTSLGDKKPSDPDLIEEGSTARESKAYNWPSPAEKEANPLPQNKQLLTICNKCRKLEQSERYVSASPLIAELELTKLVKPDKEAQTALINIVEITLKKRLHTTSR